LVTSATDIERAAIAVGADLVTVTAVKTVSTVDRTGQERGVRNTLRPVVATFIQAKVLTRIILGRDANAVGAGLVLPTVCAAYTAVQVVAGRVNALPITERESWAAYTGTGHTGLRVAALVATTATIIWIVFNIAARVVLSACHHAGRAATYARTTGTKVLVAVVATLTTICGVGGKTHAGVATDDLALERARTRA
jgi:hypothetical protein